ncbi:MAG: hypothetical protein IJL70_08680 [Treponema sp.]|nr:hypothetical protein [Treponema sp.]
MKKIISLILCVTFVFACSLSFMSCDTDDETSSSYMLPTLISSSSVSIPQKPTYDPPAPDISTGDYMFAKRPNILVTINKENGTCVAKKYANYDAYKRVAAGTAQTGDIVSTKTGELVWILTDALKWVNAYKITVDDGSASGLVRYIYGSDSYFNAYDITSEISGSSVSINKSSDLFKAVTKSGWVTVADGKYVSQSTVNINNENKYLYAVVSNSGTKFTFYLDSTNTVTDPSTLTVYDTVDGISYDLWVSYLKVEKNNWTIENSNNLFRVKRSDVMSTTVKLTAIQ